MSVNPDKVKIIMGELEIRYPEGVSKDELQKKIGNSIDAQLLYCKEKGWMTEMLLEKEQCWRATAKGVDASIIMENKNKPCFHIGDC